MPLHCAWKVSRELYDFHKAPRTKPTDGGHRQRGHRLVLDRLVDRALEVAGDLLHALAGLATLLGDAVGNVLGLVGHVLELVGGLVGDSLELVRRLLLDVVSAGTRVVRLPRVMLCAISVLLLLS